MQFGLYAQRQNRRGRKNVVSSFAFRFFAMDTTLKFTQCVFRDLRLPNLIIARMWIGYGIDAAQLTAAVLSNGFRFLPSELEFLFYSYLGILIVVAFVITVVIRIYKNDITNNKLHSIMAYFKLTALVNAGVLFFQLYLQENRESLTIFLLVIAGFDIAFNFLEMALNCAAVGIEPQITPVFFTRQ